MKTKKDYRDSKQFAAFTWICILIAVFLLAAYTIICALDNMYNDIVGILFLTLYIIVVVIMIFINRQHSAGKKTRSRVLEKVGV